MKETLSVTNSICPSREQLDEVLARAEQGDRSVLGPLRIILDQHPEIWKSYSDLGRTVLHEWIEKITRNNLAAGESLKRWCEQQMKQLAGPGAPPLVRLLAANLLACYLGATCMQLLAARVPLDAQQQLNDLIERRYDVAQRRFLQAAKQFATVCKLLGVSPPLTGDLPVGPGEFLRVGPGVTPPIEAD